MAYLRLIADSVPKLTKLAFGQKASLLGRLMLHWSSIVGNEMATKIKPAEVTYRKCKSSNRGKKHNIILTLYVANGAVALELQYQASQLIEKINMFLGSGGIDSINFVQAPDKFVEFEDNSQNITCDTLPEQEKAKIDDLVNSSEILEEDLQNALKSLGRAILNSSKTT